VADRRDANDVFDLEVSGDQAVGVIVRKSGPESPGGIPEIRKHQSREAAKTSGAEREASRDVAGIPKNLGEKGTELLLPDGVGAGGDRLEELFRISGEAVRFGNKGESQTVGGGHGCIEFSHQGGWHDDSEPTVAGPAFPAIPLTGCEQQVTQQEIVHLDSLSGGNLGQSRKPGF
jgi:hypothetical protein